MENNIINTYVKLIKNKFIEFFKITLKDKYQKNLVEIFIDKYIEVRYFNETNYPKEENFVSRLNKELLDVYDKTVTSNNENTLRTVVALFGYLTYLDDIADPSKNLSVIKLLSDDANLKIDLTVELYDELKDWYYGMREKKVKFLETVMTKDFEITKKSVYRKTYEIAINHNIKMSKIFSEYAIDKSFNSGTVSEDKLFVMYILTTLEVLRGAILFDYSNKYIVDLANTLYDKEKKVARLFNIINSPLAKKQISIKINYNDYKEHKDFINTKIKEGYSFAVVLDEDKVSKSELILFSYVYVFENSKMFDIINKDRENIEAKIIKM